MGVEMRQEGRLKGNKFRKSTFLGNESGLALLESIPVLLVFFVLFCFGLGFYGIVQTGILNTIAARTYAFETFRNRADLRYFRDSPGASVKNPGSLYHKTMVRLHSITDEVNMNYLDATDRNASGRPLSIGMTPADTVKDPDVHQQKIFEITEGKQNENVGVTPVWIMSMYGICLNDNCGGD